MSYEKYLRPLGVDQTCCSCCGIVLNRNSQVSVCSDCGAVFCSSCTKSGKSLEHQCDDEEWGETEWI